MTSSVIKFGKTSEILSQIEIEQLFKIDQDHFPWPWKKSQWLELLSTEQYHICYQSYEGIVSGFALFGMNPHEGIAHLYKIVTVSNLRKRGIAGELIDVSCIELKALATRSVYLEVSVSNTSAIQFYCKWGFEKLVRKKQFYSDGEDAFAMQKTLTESLSN